MKLERNLGVAYRATVNVSEVSGIPNNVGETYDDGYRTNKNNTITNNQPQKEMKVIANCSMLNLRGNASYGNNVYKAVKAGTKVEYLGIENGWAKISYEGRTLYCGKNYLK